DENRDTSVAWSFHAATKYVWLGDESRGRWFAMGTPPDVEAPIWEQDWSLEPFPFKIYETVPQVAIPRDVAPSPIPASQALAHTAAGVSKAFRIVPRWRESGSSPMASSAASSRGGGLQESSGRPVLQVRATTWSFTSSARNSRISQRASTTTQPMTTASGGCAPATI